MKPRWKHPCEACGLIAQTKECDVYRCEDHGDVPILVFRGVDHPELACHVSIETIEIAAAAVKKPRSGKVKAVAVRAADLKPGDLFSTVGPEYWENVEPTLAVGERVYVRTEAPCSDDQADDTMYRIEIE